MTQNGKVKGLYQEASARFGFAGWNLDATQEYESFIKKIIEEGVRLATTEYECHAWFPIEWDFGDNPDDGVGGKPPADPTTLYVELPLGADEDENPRWSFTLRDIVESMIDGFRGFQPGAGKIEDAEHIKSAKAVMNGLRELADKIESELATDA